ncbi:MAG: isoprenylcysteine carboxylmethyltransferase family protein [bacterium]|nr:isoprenylcysteine carboxylmethyltransferase family protein [bacterium]
MGDLRNFVFRIRSFTPLPLVGALLYVARPTPLSFGVGLLLMAMGEGIRIWAVAHIGGASRTRDVGAPYLTTSGPYAYVRNPLYFGNVLLYIGAATLGGEQLIWLLPVTFFYFWVQYTLIISLEEEKLVKDYGEKYQEYCKRVPRLFPVKGYVTPLDERPNDWNGALKSERSTFTSITVILALMIGYAIWRGQGW